MDFVKITRVRAKVATTRRPLPLPPPAKVSGSPTARSPSAPAAPVAEDISDVRWEKVHAVKSAIASGHYDVDARLTDLFDRFAESELPFSPDPD